MADQYQADDPDRRRAVDSEVVLEGQGRGLTVPWAPGLARSLTAELVGRHHVNAWIDVNGEGCGPIYEQFESDEPQGAVRPTVEDLLGATG